MKTHKVFHIALITFGTVLAPLEASADVQLTSGTDGNGHLLAVGAPDPRTTYTSANDPAANLALVGKGQPMGAYAGDMIGTGKSQTVTVDNLADTWADFSVRFTLPPWDTYALRLDFYADDGAKVYLNGRLVGQFDQLDAQHNLATNHLEIIDQSYFVAGTNELKFHTINTFTGHYDESAIKVRAGVDGMAIQYEGIVSVISPTIQLASGTDGNGHLLAVGAPDPRTAYTSANDPAPTLALVGKGQPIGAYTGDMIGTGKSQTVTVDNLADTWADFSVRFMLPPSNIYALRLDLYGDDGAKLYLNGRLLGTFDQLDAQHNFAKNHIEIADQSYFVAGTNELKFHTINTFTGHYDESAIKVRSGVDGMAIQYEGIVSAAPALPTIYFVHGNLGSDINNGLSWQMAKKTVQSAQELARYGDEIWVARGTYIPGSARTNSFVFKAGVSLYGGFAGTESSRQQRDWSSNPTVLSGDLSANDNGFAGNADNAYHVVVLTNEVTVDGVLVRGGNANSASAPHCYGGGIYCVNATNVSVANCGFDYNNATENGGAFYSENSSFAMAQSLFATNTAKRAGGLWVAGGRADLEGCAFKRCTTTGRPGGGIYFSATKLNIDRCWFLGNSSGFGGGIYGGFTSDLSLRNSVFSLNRCGGDSQGGTSTGGALWLENQVVASMVNCTLSGNSDSHGLYAVYGRDAVELAMTNCIIWSNVGQTVGGTLSTHVVLSHCDVSGTMARMGFDASSSATNAGGLLDLDPQFVVDANPMTENYGDVHLRSGSPCIDIGESVGGLKEDFEGDPRPSNGGLSLQMDIGADEYVPPPLSLGLNRTNSGVVLAVSGPVGARVTVQYATNLANPTYWIPLTNFVMPFSPYDVRDPIATGVPRRFYRAVR